MNDSAQQTVHGLRILLECLDADPLRAAEKYYRLLAALALFIEHRMGGAMDPDDLARKTVDIVAAKLAQGEQIQNLQAYCFGVARNVVSAGRRKAVHEQMDDDFVAGISSDQEARQEAVAKELEESCRLACLRALPEDQRSLILRYYQQGLQSKDYRERLARELKITVEALFNRISRIKKKLGDCYQHCVRAKRERTILL